MAKDKPVKEAKAATAKTTPKQTTESTQSSILQDARFQHLVSDPRFKGISKKQRKVKIDKRFQGMFDDDKFKVKYTVDKYGRRVNKSNAEDLKKYYEIDSDNDSASEAEQEAEERRKEEQAISTAADKEDSGSGAESVVDENDDLSSDGEDVPLTLKERLLDPNIDYSRGEGRLLTDSSSDEESSEDENDPELYVEHVWGELDAQAETTEESTRRLAVCNMDWDRIRATDLMVLFSSFLPPGGSILSIKIYPSEFGKERMAAEELHGPPELVGLGKSLHRKEAADSDGDSDNSDEDIVQAQDSDAEEGDDYHMEKLRQYQLNRLRYYYALVECDSVETADKLYRECDGIEYESSATRVDLRFVPDDTSFDEDEPSDICTELPDASSYQPRQFTTTALQQAKVDLTWDETAVERRELSDKLSSGKLEAVNDADLRKIIAYSSEEESEDEETETEAKGEEQDKAAQVNVKEDSNKHEKPKKKKDDVINKYRALLAEINEKEQKDKQKKYEMEFSFTVNQPKAEENANANDEDEDDSDVDSKPKPKQELTPIEKVLQKRSEKNKKRKEERKKKKLQAQGIDPDATQSDNDGDEIPDDVDMNDPYFAEEFANGDFIEPKTKKQTNKKSKQKRDEDDEETERQTKELQLLLDDDDVEAQQKQHFSLEKILKTEQETKSKRKRRKQLKKSKTEIAEQRKEVEDNFELNLQDERFKAVYASPLFNIDPTDSHFKKTKGMEQIIHEKLKRRHGDEPTNKLADEQQVESKRPKKLLENTLLVKSLKRKLQMKQQQ